MPTRSFPDKANGTISLLELRSAIEWLMEVGVSAPRLASLFGTSPENIRRIRYFATRQLEPSLITFAPALETVPDTEMHGGVGIRTHRDILRHSGKPTASLSSLAEETDIIFHRSQADYQFLAGARRLLPLKQKLGHISEARRLAMAGVLEQRISWLLVHSGLVRSAISHASRALWLLQTAYYSQEQKDDVRQFIKAVLIASHANLLASRPTATLQLLDLAEDASETIGAPLGSDFHRQRGVALFQLGGKHDDEAKKCFERSEQQMVKLNEATSDAQILMTAPRHIHLLHKPNSNGAMKVLEAVESTFGSNSLESSMTRHWTAACGLLTDDSQVQQDSRALIEKNWATASSFGHQATISKLLSITAELGLSRGLQAVWVRKALYQNAFRFK